MPTVPRLNQPLTSLQPLPSVRVSDNASAEAFGGGQSSQQAFGAAQGVGQQISNIAIQEKQRADDTATQDYFTKLANKRNGLLYGEKDADGQPVPGAYARRGKDALGATEASTAAFDKYADELESNLNETQLLMARKIRNKEKTELTQSLEKHAYQESQNFQDATHKASIETARQDAALNWATPGKVKDALETQRMLIASDPKGLGGEYVGLAVREATSKTHSEVMSSMLSARQDQVAREYFDAHKTELTPDDLERVSRELRSGTVMGETQRSATDIMSKHGSDMKSALSAAREIKDPDIQHATVSEIKTRFAENEKIKQIQDENQSGYALAHIQANKALPPPAVWNSLTAENQKTAQAYLEKVRTGTPIQTDPSIKYELQRMATANQADFLKKDLNEYVASISPEELKQFKQVQATLRAGKTDKSLDGIQTNQHIVDGTLLKNGIDPTPKKGTTDADRNVAIRSQVDKEVEAQQRELGRPLKNEEVQKIMDGIMMKVPVKNGGTDWWASLTSGKIVPKQKPAYEALQEVPAQDMGAIRIALKKKGIAPTPQAIMNLYSRVK